MWKDFFYYSKSERRAVYVLSLLIVGLLILIVILPNKHVLSLFGNPIDDSLSIRNVMVERHSDSRDDSFKDKVKIQNGSIHLNAFDPNTADSIALRQLGLSSFVVNNVLKYRQKGGYFPTPESFSRIYGLTEESYLTLKPYIYISTNFKKKEINKEIAAVVKDPIRKGAIKGFKYPIGTLVDVSTADTTELKKIPGIGSAIAQAIVSYRRRLGGFYELGQLKEVEYVTPELMKWFKLEEPSIDKIKINKMGLDALRSHPYINFYQAKIIIEFRRKRGKITSLSQLSLYEEFTEKDLLRLAPYMSFD